MPLFTCSSWTHTNSLSASTLTVPARRVVVAAAAAAAVAVAFFCCHCRCCYCCGGPGRSSGLLSQTPMLQAQRPPHATASLRIPLCCRGTWQIGIRGAGLLRFYLGSGFIVVKFHPKLLKLLKPSASNVRLRLEDFRLWVQRSFFPIQKGRLMRNAIP